ncbi:hypothetical protein KKC22_06715 [Myxococcota bacterium]|nr:hypothetical protein [Myxococcota bacterium]
MKKCLAIFGGLHKTSKMQKSIILSLLFAFFSCTSPSSNSTKQPKLPEAQKAPPLNNSEVALVWVRNGEDKPIQTYWMEAVKGQWSVIAQKPGLFMAQGESIFEVLDTYASHERPANAPPAKDAGPGEPGCDDEITELTQRDYGLFFRNLLDDQMKMVKLRSQIAPASKLAIVYKKSPMSSMLLGSIGPYLFIRDQRREVACRLNPAHVEYFYIVDSSAFKVVFKLGDHTLGDDNFTGKEDAVAWDKSYLKALYYNPILVKFRQDVKDNVGLETLETVDIKIGYFHGAPNPVRGWMEMHVVYRYNEGCRACPAVDSDPSPTTDLPTELQPFSKVHPAVQALAAQVPKGSRIGGFSVLPAPVKQKDKLQRDFLK